MAQLKGKYIEDAAIVAAKLATDAVETLKIKDANVTAAKLATNSVETLKIKDSNVTLAKMANMATDSFIGRTTADAGVQEVLSKADALAILSVEDGADVTDETNVVAALDGATIADIAVATGDKILVQDVSDADALKTVTVAEVVALASGQTKKVEVLTIASGDITAKYKDLAEVPAAATAVEVIPVGGIPQEYTVDFTVITDGADIKRLNWDTLGLFALLEADDKVIVSYTY